MRATLTAEEVQAIPVAIGLQPASLSQILALRWVINPTELRCLARFAGVSAQRRKHDVAY